MPNVAQTIMAIEGRLNQLRGATRHPQGVTTWFELMKMIMRSPNLRTATDWEITALNDTIQTDTVIDSSGGTVYGVLVDSIYDVATENLIVIVANTGGNDTLNATAYDFGLPTKDDQGQCVVLVRPAADTDTPQFGTWLDPQGQVMTDDIYAMADGEENTNPTALDVRTYVVYRTLTETRV